MKRKSYWSGVGITVFQMLLSLVAFTVVTVVLLPYLLYTCWQEIGRKLK